MSEREIPASIVNQISKSIDKKEEMAKVESRLVADDTICTRKLLIESMKSGRIPGSAFVEWADEEGFLRVNVLDFLLKKVVDAVDPSSGQSIRVKSEFIPDHSWRVLY